MSLSTVKCFNDEPGNWENILVVVWASELCGVEKKIWNTNSDTRRVL